MNIPEGWKLVGLSRAEYHDKAWALYHDKTFADTQLHKVNVHTIKTVFDACFDALPTPPEVKVDMEPDSARLIAKLTAERDELKNILSKFYNNKPYSMSEIKQALAAKHEGEKHD